MVKQKEDLGPLLEMLLRLYGMQLTHESRVDLPVGTRTHSRMCPECRLPNGRMHG
jgi:hypothetical protein